MPAPRGARVARAPPSNQTVAGVKRGRGEEDECWCRVAQMPAHVAMSPAPWTCSGTQALLWAAVGCRTTCAQVV